MLCEGGRCPVGQETIKQEQQCKKPWNKNNVPNYYFKSINQQQSSKHQKKYIEQKKLNE